MPAVHDRIFFEICTASDAAEDQKSLFFLIFLLASAAFHLDLFCSGIFDCSSYSFASAFLSVQTRYEQLQVSSDPF